MLIKFCTYVNVCTCTLTVALHYAQWCFLIAQYTCWTSLHVSRLASCLVFLTTSSYSTGEVQLFIKVFLCWWAYTFCLKGFDILNNTAINILYICYYNSTLSMVFQTLESHWESSRESVNLKLLCSNTKTFVFFPVVTLALIAKKQLMGKMSAPEQESRQCYQNVLVVIVFFPIVIVKIC